MGKGGTSIGIVYYGSTFVGLIITLLQSPYKCLQKDSLQYRTC